MIRPLNDWLYVHLEPASEATPGGIIKVVQDVYRTGIVKAAGPGKFYPDVFVPTEIKVGDRVAFLQALSETTNGKLVTATLPEDHVLIRETDVLFTVTGDVVITR